MCIGPSPPVGASRYGRPGRDDTVFYRSSKTDKHSQDLGVVLGKLGGVRAANGHPLPQAVPWPEAKEVEFVDKGPVFLTSETVRLVQEPEVCDETVEVKLDKDRVLKSDPPAASARWDGGGTVRRRAASFT